MEGGGEDVGDENCDGKICAALCTADKDDKGQGGWSGRGEEKGRHGDPAAEFVEREGMEVEDLGGYLSLDAKNAVEDEENAGLRESQRNATNGSGR
jgi:hypothetical protein